MSMKEFCKIRGIIIQMLYFPKFSMNFSSWNVHFIHTLCKYVVMRNLFSVFISNENIHVSGNNGLFPARACIIIDFEVCIYVVHLRVWLNAEVRTVKCKVFYSSSFEGVELLDYWKRIMCMPSVVNK